MDKMNVLFASFEATPFIKTGGLGDVAGSLPPAVASSTVDIRVILPKLKQIPKEYVDAMEYLCSYEVNVGWRRQYCGLFRLERNGITWYFLDNEFYFFRNQPYGCMDDGERMAFFSAAICESCRHLGDFFPNILHLNDWHTAPAAVFLRELYKGLPGYRDIKTIFTIHNIKFQGNYDPYCIGDLLGLQNYEAAVNQLTWDGRLNYLAGALNYVDRITTVSPTYAEELCTDYYGEGLQSIFRRRKSILSGILNGIDVKAYNPATDKALVVCYDTPAGKKENKLALQKQLGLTQDPNVPLLVMVSRLTEQKGLDLFNAVAEEMLSEGQIVILGSGDSQYTDYYYQLAARYPDKFSLQTGFNEALSHQIYAAGDLFLMPSRFEPCGLSQMIAMRYGTLPIVRQTGGLADSVKPYNRYTGEGTGFGFANFNAHEFLFGVRAACKIYREQKDVWESLQKQAMQADFSWKKSAAEYRKLYRSLLK